MPSKLKTLKLPYKFWDKNGHPDRVEVIQVCLEQEVLPRLLEDMPTPRTDRQRNSLRVVTNYIDLLITGNKKYLSELKKKRKKAS